MMRDIFAAGLLAPWLTACVQVNAVELDRSLSLAPLPPEQVRIYRTPLEVGAPYHEGALLEANGSSDPLREVGFIDAIGREAATLGADGLILAPGYELGPLLRSAQLLLGLDYTRYRHAIASKAQ